MLAPDQTRPPDVGTSSPDGTVEQLLTGVLTDVVATWPLRLVELTCPSLLSAPLSVASSGEVGVLHLRQLLLPATGPLAEGSLLVVGPTAQALTGVQALPSLLSALVEAEVRRAGAEVLARTALQVANVDPMTGLGNRRAWVQALHQECSRASRGSASLAVLVLDVDGLKTVNDTYGHAAGDELISRTASALLRASRTTDAVCRLGGDEFGIAAPATDRVQGQLLARRVRRLLAADGVSASVGVAVTDDCTGGADELWQRADAAMYAAKRAARRAD